MAYYITIDDQLQNRRILFSDFVEGLKRFVKALLKKSHSQMQNAIKIGFI